MIKATLLLALIALSIMLQLAKGDNEQQVERLLKLQKPLQAPPVNRVRRDKHKAMMHNHLSRKVFDRACAASKDTIDEIIACLTGNQVLLKAVKEETAKTCYKDSFGLDFNPQDVAKHKELICNNRDKFENMTACVYMKTAEAMNPQEVEKMTEAMIDVGLCIINALDG